MNGSGSRAPRSTAEAVARLRAHPWPAPLLAALARLREGGHRAYLVGGSVRDVLLDRPPDDVWDVATDLAPGEVGRRFARVEPIGLAHGTVLLIEGDTRIECTTFRREGEYSDARHPDHVAFTDDPIADLARRDLTVNAMAWDPAAGELLDPFGGVADLAAGTLRAVGDPVARVREDALRPLRVARLAARLAFEVEPATRSALGAAGDRAGLVAWERVRDELEKLLAAPRPSLGLELLREAGLLERWLPELAHTVDVPQNRWHAFDVYRHSLAACDAAPADHPIVRWAALLHDVGKPDTRGERRGQATFYEHARVGAGLADRLLARLRVPNETRERIVHLVREHMVEYRSEWSDAALRRWLRRVGTDAMDDLFALRDADVAAKGVASTDPDPVPEMRVRLARVIAASPPLSIRDLAIDGGDVMRVLRIGPGPEVGRALHALLDDVIEDPARNTRESLLARLAERRDARANARPNA